jgi:uncharacterized cofD-like protein
VSGDFISGIEVASEILKVKGRVVPVTSNKAELLVTLGDGKVLFGENVLNHADVQEHGIAHIGYKDDVTINNHAYEALLSADVIVLGPGNYYCSIIPCIITDGFKGALQKTNAKLVFPVNLTNKQGHTMGWTVTEYVSHVEEFIERKFDYVLINNELPSDEQIKQYEIEEGDGVMVVDDYKEDNAIRIPLLSHTLFLPKESDAIASVRSFIRHDSKHLAEGIIDIL